VEPLYDAGIVPMFFLHKWYEYLDRVQDAETPEVVIYLIPLFFIDNYPGLF